MLIYVAIISTLQVVLYAINVALVTKDVFKISETLEENEALKAAIVNLREENTKLKDRIEYYFSEDNEAHKEETA